MWLQLEGGGRVDTPSDWFLRDAIMMLRNEGPISFAILTDKQGNYTQVAGGALGCVVERRVLKPLNHDRAHKDAADPAHLDGDRLKSGAGEISLRPDEWFTLEEAADIMLTFFKKKAWPSYVRWRSMNETFGI